MVVVTLFGEELYVLPGGGERLTVWLRAVRGTAASSARALPWMYVSSTCETDPRLSQHQAASWF